MDFLKKALWMSLFVAMLCPMANADVIAYGDLSGTDVMYIGIAENTQVAGDVSDFGAPSVVGNLLDFDPIDFQAPDPQNGGALINDGNLQFTLMAKDGQVLESALLREGGDWTAIGAGVATYGAAIRWEIVEIDNAPATTQVTGTASLTDTFSSPGTAVLWDDEVTIDFSQAILDAPNVSGKATKVEFSIDNVLTASGASGETFIAKKDLGFQVYAMVPEPSSLVALLVGCVSLLGFLRRRR